MVMHTEPSMIRTKVIPRRAHVIPHLDVSLIVLFLKRDIVLLSYGIVNSFF
jgi:hypothetical protein